MYNKKNFALCIGFLAVVCLFSGCTGDFFPFDIESAPPPPVNVSAAAVGYDCILVTWKKVYNTSGYEIHRSLDGVSFTFLAEINITSFADTDLEPDTVYYYQIKSVRKNYIEGTEFSSPVSATTLSNPLLTLETPALSIDDGGFSREAVLSWPVINGASSYEMYGKTGASDMIRIAQVSAADVEDEMSLCSYTVSLSNTVVHSFRVKAVGSTGSCSQLSNTVTVTAGAAENIEYLKADPLAYDKIQTFCFPSADKGLWFSIVPAAASADISIECLTESAPFIYTLYKKTPQNGIEQASSGTCSGSSHIALSFDEIVDGTNAEYCFFIGLATAQTLTNQYSITLSGDE